MKRERSGNRASWFLSIFGLPFLGAGLFLAWLYYDGFATWLDARDWVEAPCWIESAELEAHSGDDSTSYKAVATYRYRHAGQMWRGDRVSLGFGADNIGNFQQQAHAELAKHVRKIPDGVEVGMAAAGEATFRCYVNPRNPAESVLFRTLRWEMLAFKAIFALTFPAVGLGLVLGGVLAVSSSRKQAALRNQYPEEPWLWRQDWAAGSIGDVRGKWAVALHAYTLWSGLIVGTLVLATAMSGAFENEKSSWLVMIFVGLWLLPAAFSFRRLRHHWLTGGVRFEPASVPAVPGGALDGFLVLSKPLPMRSVAELSLKCERVVTTQSGSKQSTSRENVWSHQESVAVDSMTRDVSGFRLPLRFSIPAHLPGTTRDGDDAVKHVWGLDFKVPGTPVRSTFELPVFDAGGAPAVPLGPDEWESADGEIVEDLPGRLAARRIQAEFSADGTPVSLVCPPGRNRAALVFFILFDIVWTAAAVFLIVQQAPLVFRLVWPLSALAIWCMVIWLLLHKRTATFGPTGLVVQNRLGPKSWTTTLQKSAISGFEHDTNMSSNNTSYYRVRARGVDKRLTTVVDGITESATAATLVKRLDRWRVSNG